MVDLMNTRTGSESMRKCSLLLVFLGALMVCAPGYLMAEEPAAKNVETQKKDSPKKAEEKGEKKPANAVPAADKDKKPAARVVKVDRPEAAKPAKRAPAVAKKVTKKVKKKKNIVVHGFEVFVGFLGKTVFFPIFGFPFVVIILVLGSIFFTFRMGFINLRGFAHSIQIIRGKYDNPDDEGEISHFQALTSSLSATVGLGNIAGVAVAVGKGGAGAVFWMILIAFFGMTAKFVECSLAQMWRTIEDDGTVHGGPMYYISRGLEEKNLGVAGKFLGGFFAVCIIGGAFGGGNMFQANQSFELIAKYVPATTPVMGVNPYALGFGLLLAIIVGLIILGGIKRIGSATSKIVPFMVALYIGTAIIIILMNVGRIPGLLVEIVQSAFNPGAMYGGLLGVMVIGISRAVFSNEAGIGSAAIAHSAAKTDEPIREGMVAMIGPFIDTVMICLMTASVILLTAPDNKTLQAMQSAQKNVYTLNVALAKAQKEKKAKAIIAGLKSKLSFAKKDYKSKSKGAAITSAAFGSVFSWFPILLSIVVFLFAYSTMVSWSYYGERGWAYLFGSGSIMIYRMLFLCAIVLGSVANLGVVLDFSDIMIFLCAFPNIIAGVLLSGIVKERLDDYWTRFQKGEFKEYK